jgi:tetratricopeptide (TPR) repeat protein
MFQKKNVSFWLISCFWLFASAYVLILLAPSFLIPNSWWPFKIVNLSGISVALPGIVFIVISLMEFRYKIAERILQPFLSSRRNYLIFLVTCGLLILAAMFLYSVPHYLLGDGNLILGLTGPNVKYPFKIGDENIKGLITLTAALCNWSTDGTFRLLSASGGILYLISAILILIDIEDKKIGIILFGILLAQPFLLFFSNYIETYPLLLGIFAFFLALNLRLGNGLKDYIFLGIIYIILLLLHPLFLVFVFSFACRWFLLKYKVGTVIWFFIGAAFFGFAGYVFSSAVGLQIFGSDLFSIFSKSDQVYTLFSKSHIADYLKYVAFFGLPAILLLWILPSMKSLAKTKGFIIFPYALSSAIFLFIADFKLGAFDWDVTSMAGFPIVLFSIVSVKNIDEGLRSRSALILFVFSLALLKLFPWIEINGNLMKAAGFVMDTAKYDAHQQLNTRIYSMSTRLRELGLVKQSLELSKVLIKTDSQNPVAQNNYAQDLIQQGNYSEALEILQSLTERFPGYFYGNSTLGKLYYEKIGKVDSAQKYLAKALQIRPDASDILYALAFIHLREAKFDTARNELLLTIASDPLHSNAHAALGLIDVQLGNVKEGIEHLDKSLSLGGLPKQTLEVISQTFEKLGLHEKAAQSKKMSANLR